MTDPNIPTKADILEARERVKRGVPSSHWRDIDEGKWDAWGAVQAALNELIRERAGEERETAE